MGNGFVHGLLKICKKPELRKTSQCPIPKNQNDRNDLVFLNLPSKKCWIIKDLT